MKALESLLVAFSPAAAFSPSVLGARGAVRHPARRASHPVVMQARNGLESALSRRSQLKSALFVSALAGMLTFSPPEAVALPGAPPTFTLNVKEYAETECPEELAQGRAGGSLGAGANGAGIAQKCVKVTAAANNPENRELIDVAVFGRVFNDQDGMSVLGNGQDGKNDAGQFSVIPKVPPGKSDLSFIFVSQQSDDCRNRSGYKCPIEGTKPLVPLRFEKVKAIAYPKTGAKQFKLYDECEQNPFGEGCDN